MGVVLRIIDPESTDITALVKSNLWSIINAAFWLVELLLGYMLQPTSSEKRRLWKPTQRQTNRVLLAKIVLSSYFFTNYLDFT